ncbi:hypothetical protein C1H46_012298 [Malus baccata]|uniref:Uncharacterized protein n=1 Tax=Malus baccata TaxID=106549 RepID=A0A540MTK9_MALBA|nr:hypothetical protein C1H46_012298 [Malus baccata]
MNMKDLILRLRVEEDHRKADRFGGFAAIEANVNYVEGGNSKAKPKKNKAPAPKTKQFVQSALAPKGKNLKKIKGACYVCGNLVTRHKIVIIARMEIMATKTTTTMLTWQPPMKNWLLLCPRLTWSRM